MFNITAYQTTSAANVVDKAVSEISVMQGVLRKGCSIIDPVIIVQTDGGEIWRRGFNYMYIDAFQRYYYVTNIVAVSGTLDVPTSSLNPAQLWEIHGHVDVLKSFSEEIKAQSAVVARQEREYNLMLDDGFFMTYQNPKIQTKVFSNATPFENQEFVLVVAGS